MRGYKIMYPGFNEAGITCAESRNKAKSKAKKAAESIDWNIDYTKIKCTRDARFDGCTKLYKEDAIYVEDHALKLLKESVGR